MTSEKKVKANRENAKKSTGPSSARGKAQSKMNALTIGIFARSPLIPGESEKEYRELERWLWDEFQPTGAREEFFFRQVLRDMWHMQRIDRGEQSFFIMLRNGRRERLKRRDFREAYIAGVLERMQRESPEKIGLTKKDVEWKLSSAIDEAESAAFREGPFVENADITLRDGLVLGSPNNRMETLDRYRNSAIKRLRQSIEALESLQEKRLMTANRSPQSPLNSELTATQAVASETVVGEAVTISLNAPAASNVSVPKPSDATARHTNQGRAAAATMPAKRPTIPSQRLNTPEIIPTSKEAVAASKVAAADSRSKTSAPQGAPHVRARGVHVPKMVERNAEQHLGPTVAKAGSAKPEEPAGKVVTGIAGRFWP